MVFVSLFFSQVSSASKSPPLLESLFLVPVPKIKSPKRLNDLRPAARSSLVMVKKEIVCATQGKLGPLQFAYGAGRGVEDAVCTLLRPFLSF